MVTVDYETSLLPHKCKRCNRMICPKKRHVRMYLSAPTIDLIRTIRFCSPHCAAKYYKDEKARVLANVQKRRDLERVVFGGDDE